MSKQKNLKDFLKLIMLPGVYVINSTSTIKRDIKLIIMAVKL